MSNSYSIAAPDMERIEIRNRRARVRKGADADSRFLGKIINSTPGLVYDWFRDSTETQQQAYLRVRPPVGLNGPPGEPVGYLVFSTDHVVSYVDSEPEGTHFGDLAPLAVDVPRIMEAAQLARRDYVSELSKEQ